MKKLFLLGTMLGVASAALAFGGMFNHGNKSTTYKGGVDAIGVHFGGEKKTADSEPKKETCPAEKQCGDYCCQGDNVCHQDPDSGELQCCSEELDWCCNVSETAYPAYGGVPGCCAGTTYCPSVDIDGDCTLSYLACCPNGEPYLQRITSYGESYSCCSGTLYKNKGLDGSNLCCEEGETLTCAETDEQENCLLYTCCPSGQTGFCSVRNQEGKCLAASCCNKSSFQSGYDGNNTYYSCCPVDLTCVEEENGACIHHMCCDGDVALVRDLGSGTDTYKCCPKGYTGFCAHRAGRCMETKCCSGEVTIGNSRGEPDICSGESITWYYSY